MSSESRTTTSGRDNSCAQLANTALVFQGNAITNTSSNHITTDKNNPTATMGPKSCSSSSQPDVAPRLQDIRESYTVQGLSSKATNIIVNSWRPSTSKLYESYIGRWKTYCNTRQIDCVRPTIGQALDFLVCLFETGIGYSSINTARSALSCLIEPINNITFGSHPTVWRFMKGIYQLRPPTPRYENIWDASIVLNYLKTLTPLADISLKVLTLKLTMLIALVSAQRRQSIHLLSIDNLVRKDNLYEFTIREHVKQSRPGYKPPIVKLPAFPENQDLCVVSMLEEYLRRTEPIRGEHKQLLLSHVKPHKPVSADTISRWLKLVLCNSGIDTKVFKAHSTRSASVSKAKANGVNVVEIMSTAGWSSECTFAKFYNKPIVSDSGQRSLASTLLQVVDD